MTKKVTIEKRGVINNLRNHHRMGHGLLSGGERVKMLKENLEFQLDEKCVNCKNWLYIRVRKN